MLDTTEAQFEKVIAVNLAFFGTQLAAKLIARVVVAAST